MAEPAFSESLLNDGLAIALEWGPNLSKPYGPRLADRHPELTEQQLAEVEKICKGAMDFGHNLVYDLASKFGGVSKIEGLDSSFQERYPWVDAELEVLILDQSPV